MDHFGTPSGEGPVRGSVEIALDVSLDESASFEDFFARERDRLFGLLVLVTGDRHEAEDLAQDAFVATWERWDRVGTVDNPGAGRHAAGERTVDAGRGRVAKGVGSGRRGTLTFLQGATLDDGTVVVA